MCAISHDLLYKCSQNKGARLQNNNFVYRYEIAVFPQLSCSREQSNANDNNGRAVLNTIEDSYTLFTFDFRLFLLQDDEASVRIRAGHPPSPVDRRRRRRVSRWRGTWIELRTAVSTAGPKVLPFSAASLPRRPSALSLSLSTAVCGDRSGRRATWCVRGLRVDSHLDSLPSPSRRRCGVGERKDRLHPSEIGTERLRARADAAGEVEKSAEREKSRALTSE